MHLKDISIATITWARDAAEEALLREALQHLAALQLPVFITDGGSNSDFTSFIQSFPQFTLVPRQGKGLWLQVASSLQAAHQSGSPFILYTEPDKMEFFHQYLRGFLQQAGCDPQTGVVLASRSPGAFATFPHFQQSCETTINFCTAEVTGRAFDYTYGPFLFNRNLVPFMQQVQHDVGWGWRPYLFCLAHRLAYRMDEISGEFECPPNQRGDDATERIYRMKQLSQNIEGVVLAAGAALTC